MVISSQDEKATLLGKKDAGVFIVAIDPIDNISNIEENNCLGSIFCIWRK